MGRTGSRVQDHSAHRALGRLSAGSSFRFRLSRNPDFQSELNSTGFSRQALTAPTAIVYDGGMNIRTIGAAATLLTIAAAAEMATVEPKELASQLQAKGAQPTLIHVGFAVMYRSKHIPASIYAGPASKPEGLDALKRAASPLPRDREMVVYCGCCPFDRCPNVKPAIDLLKQMGFTHVRTLMIPANFGADWVDHGYPVEEGIPAK